MLVENRKLRSRGNPCQILDLTGDNWNCNIQDAIFQLNDFCIRILVNILEEVFHLMVARLGDRLVSHLIPSRTEMDTDRLIKHRE